MMITGCDINIEETLVHVKVIMCLLIIFLSITAFSQGPDILTTSSMLTE